ncbi:hypothetical protein SAMN05216553_106497 [Lentzea fradiae]|uniref:Uncharacterized protein n=1 Tax=Lentzea fradiae TaxID=200378 RepID=A0A1G7SVH0_9PSEU|nr:hypothetical protein SAMN05216553_106497 [Lentzea fradiae]
MNTVQLNHDTFSAYRNEALTAMSLNDEFVRIRIQEAQRYAEEQRLANRLATAQRWRRLSRWAGRRAARFDL